MSAANKNKACWSKIVEESGVQVRIFERERGGLIYRSVTAGGKKDRKSLGHRDKKLAEKQAKELARALAEMRLTGADTRALTLGQLFAFYREAKMPQLSSEWTKAAETRIALFIAAWGRDIAIDDIDQTRIDSFAAARRAGTLSPLSERKGRGARAPVAVRDGTIESDLRWLSSVFNAARKRRVNGRPLLRENPLHSVERPREKNPRRPVASKSRYELTQAHTDAIDSAGRLRCALAIARHTGHRESAILNLWASDLLFSPERLRSALVAVNRDETEADYMPNGGILWRAQHDKMRIAHVSPLSRAAREELDLYLRRSPRVGDVPLFPAPEKERVSIGRRVASRWLLKAEAKAGLPKLAGGIWHPYRRAWATERKHMPDVDVAAAGGWADTRALKAAYQQADVRTMLNVVEGG